MNKMVKCKSCGQEIAKSAKVCPHCGARQKKNVALGIILLVVGIFLFVSGIIGFDSSNSQDVNETTSGEGFSQSAPVKTEKSKEPENKSAISLSEFNQIDTGMTYDEVVAIIGSDGEVLSEVDLGTGEEYKTIMYTWKGKGSIGANANITFQGGKVISKAQLGLK